MSQNSPAPKQAVLLEENLVERFFGLWHIHQGVRGKEEESKKKR